MRKGRRMERAKIVINSEERRILYSPEADCLIAYRFASGR